MIEIEKYPRNDGNETRTREEYWRSHFNAKLNTFRAYIPEEERKEQMKEQTTKSHKKKITCECGCMIRNDGLTEHKKTQKHLLRTKQIKYEFVDDNDDN